MYTYLCSPHVYHILYKCCYSSIQRSPSYLSYKHHITSSRSLLVLSIPLESCPFACCLPSKYFYRHYVADGHGLYYNYGDHSHNYTNCPNRPYDTFNQVENGKLKSLSLSYAQYILTWLIKPSSRDIVKAAFKGHVGLSTTFYKQRKELQSPPHLTNQELVHLQHVLVGKLAGALIGCIFSTTGSLFLPHFLFSATYNLVSVFRYQSKIHATRVEATRRELNLDGFQALLPRILASFTIRIIFLAATVGVSEFTVLGDGSKLLDHMGHLQDVAATHFQPITPDALPTTSDPIAWQATLQNLHAGYTNAHQSVLEQIGELINAPSQIVNAPVDDLVADLTDGTAAPNAVPTWGIADGFTGVNTLPLHTIGEDMVADGVASSVEIGMAEAFVELNLTAGAVDVAIDKITDEPAGKIAGKVDRKHQVPTIQQLDEKKS